MEAVTILAPAVTYVTIFVACAGIILQFWSISQAAYADYEKVYVAEARVALSDIFSTFPPERVFQASVLAAGTVFLLAFLAVNTVAGLLFGSVAFFAPRMLFNIARDKRRALFEQQLVDGLELLSNSVRAGMTLPQAMELLVKEMKPPITQEFGRMLQEYRLGTDFDQAMLNMARRMGSRDLDVLVNAIAITRRSGGNVGEIFQSIGATIRDRVRIEGKIKAVSAMGNLQALVMAGMPFGLLVALWFMEPLYVQLLFSETLGLIALGVVIALVVVAFLWIRRIMDIDI